MSKKSNYGWVMAALAFFILFTGSYAQYQLSPLSYLLIPQMNLSTSQFSSVFSAAMIPGICLSLISGLLCDRLGVKKSITAAVIIATLGIVFRIFSGSYVTLFGCMILSGFGCTFVNSNIAKYLGGWFPPRKLGTMIGLTMSGTTFAMAIGMGTTAFFPSIKSAYIFSAVLSVAVLAAWLIFARKSDAEKSAGEKKALPQASILKSLKEVMKNKYVWIAGVCLMFLMGSLLTLSAFLPIALQAVRSISTTDSGFVASVMMFGNLAGTIFGPIICARMKSRKGYLFVCAFLAAAGVAFAWYLPIGLALYLGMFITGFAVSGSLPIYMSIPIMLPKIGPGLAGTAGGFIATIQLFGCVVIPTYIIAPIAGTNYGLIMILAGLCCLLCSLCALLIPDSINHHS